MPADLERVTRNVDIVEAILMGKTAQEAGQEFGISDRQVYRILNDENYREILTQGQREQVTMLPKANRKLNALLDSEDEGITLKAVAQVHKNTGIAPTLTPNIFIGQLIQGAQINAVSSPVLGLLQAALAHKRAGGDIGPVVDVTPKENAEDDPGAV